MNAEAPFPSVSQSSHTSFHRGCSPSLLPANKPVVCAQIIDEPCSAELGLPQIPREPSGRIGVVTHLSYCHIAKDRCFDILSPHNFCVPTFQQKTCACWYLVSVEDATVCPSLGQCHEVIAGSFGGVDGVGFLHVMF